MNSPDAVAAMKTWHDLVIPCDQSQAEKLLNQTESALVPDRWARGTVIEDRLKNGGAYTPGSRCFVRLDADGSPRVALWLFPNLTPPGLKAGSLIALKNQSDYSSGVVGEAADEFVRSYLKPSASALGLSVELAQPPSPLKRVPYSTRRAIEDFLDGTNRSGPGLTREDARKWDEVIITAYRDDAILEADELRKELERKGFAPSTAETLARMFSSGLRLLSEYDTARRPA